MTNKLNTWFVGSDGRKSPISIYYPKNDQNAKVLLFLHGFKGFKDWGHFPLIQQRFAEKGFIVVAFNFSHNGGTLEQSIDFPDLAAFSNNTYLKEVDDVGFVLSWIFVNESKYFKDSDLEQISILGHSRGGGIALLAGKKYHVINKVVTWAAVADFIERLPNHEQLNEWKRKGVYYIKNGRTEQNMPMNYNFVEDLLNHRNELSIENAVSKIEKPLLIVHGEEDETVELENAQRIKSWNADAQLLVVTNCNHTFNGKHPWTQNTLPEATLTAVDQSVEFLNR